MSQVRSCQESTASIIIILALLSRFLKGFTQSVQGLAPALISKHMPGGDDNRNGPLDKLESDESCDPCKIGELLRWSQANLSQTRKGDI